MRFCPECGTPVEVMDVPGEIQQMTSDSQKKNQEKGIYVEQNFGTLHQLTEKAVSRVVSECELWRCL